ncbi:glutamate-rich protein 6 [Chanos chanos]|uniref:Glutamate-rich protein 6 n=1 Tax=Chanos chanos TaxID=29144 RepID=A0A6J2VFT4_CHACN|nr:glutamate-rich protein 6-like [Chanos chanos]
MEDQFQAHQAEAAIQTRVEEADLNSLESPGSLSQGLPGVLRYKRESQESAVNPKVFKTQDFCCSQYQRMLETVAQEKRQALEGSIREPTQSNNSFAGKEEELSNTEGRQQQRQIERYYEESRETHRTALSAETNPRHAVTINFQLSGCGSREDIWFVKQDSGIEEDHGKCMEDDLTESGPFEFRMSNLKDSPCLLEKHYPGGNKFLTVFPDGSGQVLYPSGQLAVILLTSGKKRVCIVQDENNPKQPIRALFQSSGQTTCYHGNGTIWLSMDIWGGQCLDENGARTKRWSWSDHAQTPTPLRPIFLSLNKRVGVRVLGQGHVFVSFLALGQQVRLSVGSCLKPVHLPTPSHVSPISKEELFVLAGRVRARLALLRLQWCNRFPSSRKALRAGPPAFLLSAAQRLLSLSDHLPIDEQDRKYIHTCLQGCFSQ